MSTGDGCDILQPVNVKLKFRSEFMAYETIIYKAEGDIGRITFNRPQAMNAITPTMLKELKSAVLEAGKDPEAKVIVLTGAGKAFCAGVDLKALGDQKLVNGKVGDILDIPARELIDAIRKCPRWSSRWSTASASPGLWRSCWPATSGSPLNTPRSAIPMPSGG
jgi:1,4-dihydroxy-2-naphthoyl-CoA synthase